MTRSWIFVPLLAVALAVLVVSACNGGGGEPSASDQPQDTGPTSSGAVADNVFMTFEGQRYQLREVLQADLISDEFSELGVASEADVEHQGELTVYRRAGDDAAVYTFAPALDVGAEEGGVPALWQRWELAE